MTISTRRSAPPQSTRHWRRAAPTALVVLLASGCARLPSENEVRALEQKLGALDHDLAACARTLARCGDSHTARAVLVRLHDARTARRHLTQRITALRLAAARASIATAADRVVTRAHRVLADVEQACGALEQRIRAQSPTPPAQQ